jgi:hypothetical protein
MLLMVNKKPPDSSDGSDRLNSTILKMNKDISFSGYKNAKSKTPIETSFRQEMESIQNGDYQNEVETARQVRDTTGKSPYDEYRLENVWCFTPGVNNKKYGKDNPTDDEYTGLLTLDIDKAQDFDRSKNILKSYPWVLAVSKSIGGIGLFAIIKCDSQRLAKSHASAVRILSSQGVIISPGQENPNRIRYCAWDPDIYFVDDPVGAPCVPTIQEDKKDPIKPISLSSEQVRLFIDTGCTQNMSYDNGLMAAIGRITRAGCSFDDLASESEYMCRYMDPQSAHNSPERLNEIIIHCSKDKSFQEGASVNVNGTLEHVAGEIDLEQYRITKELFIPEDQAVIKIGESKVAAMSNLTTISAESKAGKTALMSVFIAGAISRDGIIDGFTDVWTMPNRDSKAVIHLDTEQSRSDQQYNLNTVLARANFSKTPDYYLSYNIKTLSIDQYQPVTLSICEKAANKFNGIHSIFVDGPADFMLSINNDEQSPIIIKFFTDLATLYSCPVIVVIHLNENAGKNGDTVARGHIGRQSIRKGYGQLNITRKGDVSIVETLRCRKAGHGETPVLYFKYDSIKGYHVSTNAETAKNEKEDLHNQAELDKLQKIVNTVFGGQKSLTWGESIEQITKFSLRSPETAEKYLKRMKIMEMVTMSGKLYRQNLESPYL